MPLSERVRQALREQLRARPGAGPDHKLEVARAASRHRFRTANIERMRAEIAQGLDGYPGIDHTA